MTTSLILAPGDVLFSVRHELAERGIRVRLTEQFKDGESKDKDGKDEDGQDQRISGGGGENKQKGGDESSDRTTEAKSRDTVTATEVGKHTDGDGGSGESDKGSTRTGTEIGGGVFVLTSSVSKALAEYGNIMIYESGGGTVIFLDKNLQNEFNLSKSDRLEQVDALRELKQKHKKDVQIRTISTIASLEKILGERKIVSKQQDKVVPITGIHHVSNRIEDVKDAKAYFTCPTGDVTWKEVAKAAGQNKNIMAYYHDGKEDAGEQFIHLIDHM
ncbi:minor core protein [Chuzan virus]|uniref:Minor core protein n=1 Tax=Chuzan virus TaxID=77204 RepID=A0A109RY65_9REOV|nr:minor core protein [Chuzan virus]